VEAACHGTKRWDPPKKAGRLTQGEAATLDYNIGTRVPMWKLFTPNGATGIDFALNLHVLYLLSSRVPVCRQEFDFR
jgi:hypothetical protein